MLKVDGLDKNKDHLKHIIDHNIALILVSYNQITASKSILHKTLTFFTKDKSLP